MNFVYKLVTPQAWARARDSGAVAPAEIDRKDGYIHLSTAAQTLETARRHFSEAPELLALEIDPDRVDGEIRFEIAPTRGEAFPHLYGALPLSAVVRVRPLRREGAGFVFEDGAP
jgi:uncharacterized protein (DUF952 family)